MQICYYFTDSWEQFRIHGILDLIGHADSDSARKLVGSHILLLNESFMSTEFGFRLWTLSHGCWRFLLQLREKAWFDSSPRSRGAFAAPHPGHPKASESSEPPQVDPDQGPLDTFCVLTLEPEEVSLNSSLASLLQFLWSLEWCHFFHLRLGWVSLQIDYYHAKDAVRILFKIAKTENGHKEWSREEVNPWTSMPFKL